MAIWLVCAAVGTIALCTAVLAVDQAAERARAARGEGGIRGSVVVIREQTHSESQGTYCVGRFIPTEETQDTGTPEAAAAADDTKPLDRTVIELPEGKECRPEKAYADARLVPGRGFPAPEEDPAVFVVGSDPARGTLITTAVLVTLLFVLPFGGFALAMAFPMLSALHTKIVLRTKDGP
ncbi:hypothetical protein G6045_31420 [Streptomyces sp. YC504]|uniref:DUF3592 domain-containing protein n=1 Tax=Streptomyces mesophilus TaxID=1775132 RepID=A0A6G4XTW4_9ACTN|nr:hypothetical protein [Streptomyces mesophilus]NGO80134.1 hypothetical protein [Streptomyces mesophilus]